MTFFNSSVNTFCEIDSNSLFLRQSPGPDKTVNWSGSWPSKPSRRRKPFSESAIVRGSIATLWLDTFYEIRQSPDPFCEIRQSPGPSCEIRQLPGPEAGRRSRRGEESRFPRARSSVARSVPTHQDRISQPAPANKRLTVEGLVTSCLSLVFFMGSVVHS